MHTYSVELVLPEEEIVILSKFEMDLPHTSSVFMLSLLGQDKKPFQLKHLRTVMHAFLALHRRHMRQDLCAWAHVTTMAKMAKGENQAAIELLVVGTGFASQMKQTEALLRRLHPKMMKAINEANGRHPFVTMGMDNFQKAFFHSCGPMTYLVGTVRYVKEFLLPLVVQGALVLCRATGVLYYVSDVWSHSKTGLIVVLKAIMPTSTTASTVPMTTELPNLGWEIIDFDPLNLPRMSPVTYKNQVIPMPRHLPPLSKMRVMTTYLMFSIL
jgi:hypothetical protein